MTPRPGWIGGFRWMYSMLLYAYPRGFRVQYGAAMGQLFRDRCRDLERTPGGWRAVRFAVHVAADWLASVVREQASAIWSAGRMQSPQNFVTEWALTIVVYLFAATTLVQAYVIPTGSMEGNLKIGDHLLVDRLAYSDPGTLGRSVLPYRDLERGDIVVFRYPEDIRQTFVKRVIGLPGDRIRLSGGQVIRNGHRLAEPYVQHTAAERDAYRDDFPLAPDGRTTPRGREMFANNMAGGEVVVPPDALFVMGDNRDNSLDSRYWGFVPRSNVVGKPLLVYWSYDAPTAHLERWNLTHVVDVALHFFTRTRWERTLLAPRSQAARELESAE